MAKTRQKGLLKIDKLTDYTYSCNSLTNSKMKRMQLPETEMIWSCWNLIGKFVKSFHLNFFGGFNLRGATVHHWSYCLRSNSASNFSLHPYNFEANQWILPHTLQLSSFISWQSVCKFFSVFSPRRKITFKIIPSFSAGEIQLSLTCSISISLSVPKDLLISKGLFGVIVWTKKPTKFPKDFCPCL